MAETAQLTQVSLNGLRRSLLFITLNDSQFDLILSQVQILNCKLGTVLCEQGKPAEELYVLVAGKVRFTIETERERDATLCTFNRIGDFFGGKVSRQDGSSPFTARASSDSSLLRIKPSTLDLIATHSESFRNCLSQARRLWQWHRRLFTFSRFDQINYWQIHSLLQRCTSASTSPQCSNSSNRIALLRCCCRFLRLSLLLSASAGPLPVSFAISFLLNL